MHLIAISLLYYHYFHPWALAEPFHSIASCQRAKAVPPTLLSPRCRTFLRGASILAWRLF